MVIAVFAAIVAGANIAALVHNPPQSSQAISLPVGVLLPQVPGAYNPNVTQKTIYKTVCVSGYTRRIRPGVHYTQAIKEKQVHDLGYTDTDIKHYEEDHFIPLELGGHPINPNNLWPEPWMQANRSDPYENLLHTQLCRGDITLLRARRTIVQYKEKNG